jgi:hypothetical protein
MNSPLMTEVFSADLADRLKDQQPIEQPGIFLCNELSLVLCKFWSALASHLTCIHAPLF